MGKFLSSEDSRYVLNTDPHKGWFGKDAQDAMPNFKEDLNVIPNCLIMDLNHGMIFLQGNSEKVNGL